MAQGSFWGSGWSFPPTFNKGDHQLQMSHNEQNINQSIDLILSTLQGERSVAPDFGSDLRHFLFNNMDATAQGQLISSIKSTLLSDEPRIDINSIDVQISDESEPKIEVFVDYTVRMTNSRHNHVFPFSLNEGTNLTTTTTGVVQNG